MPAVFLFVAAVNYFALHEAVQSSFRVTKLIDKVVFNRHEASFLDPHRVVESVFAHVVILSENPLPFALVEDRVILEGMLAYRVEERYLKYSEAVGAKHAADFAHRLDVIADVFQHVIAENKVKTVRRKRNFMDIHFDLGEGRFNVRRDILVPMQPLKPGNKACLRGNVQDGHLLLEKWRSFFQVQPDQPVPLQRKAIRTKCIGSWVDPSIRQKSPEAGVANRTVNLTAAVKQPDNL